MLFLTAIFIAGTTMVPADSLSRRVDRQLSLSLYSKTVGGSSSVVECFLAKEDVAGSTPVSRSIKSLSAIHSPEQQG